MFIKCNFLTDLVNDIKILWLVNCLCCGIYLLILTSKSFAHKQAGCVGGRHVFMLIFSSMNDIHCVCQCQVMVGTLANYKTQNIVINISPRCKVVLVSIKVCNQRTWTMVAVSDLAYCASPTSMCLNDDSVIDFQVVTYGRFFLRPRDSALNVT